MEQKKEDRRIRKTRKLLKHGLSELMKEKDLKDISIKDITDRTDLNRGTFYLHYTDIYDLLAKIEDDVINDFQSMIDAHKPKTSTKTLMPIIEPIADYIGENLDICKILFENKGSTDFSNKFKQLVYKNGHLFINERYGNPNSELMEYFFGFITYGIMGLIKQWFETGTDRDKAKIIELCDKIISSSAASVFD